MITLAVGGIAYQSKVHVAHLQSVLTLGVLSDENAFVIGHVEYAHSSNLPQARSLWLRKMISEHSLTHALSLDSDTSFDPMQMCNELNRLNRLLGPLGLGTAIHCVPVVRDTNPPSLNLFVNRGESISLSSCGSGYPTLWAGGFGCVLFNLDWFRLNWNNPFPEQFGDSEDWINQGEDIQMCRSVINRGGKVRPLWVGTRHWDSTGSRDIGIYQPR